MKKKCFQFNQIKTGATLSYINMGVAFFISLIYTPLMIRLLGPSEYGLYNLVVSVVSYLSIFNFGFGSTYVRYYSRLNPKTQKKEIAQLNGMFITIFTILGIIVCIIGFIIAYNSEFVFGSELTNIEQKIAKVLVVILVVNLGLSFPSIIFTSYITANEKFIFQRAIQFLKVILNPLLVLPILYMEAGSIGLAIMTTLINIIAELLYVIYAFKKLHIEFSFKNFDFILMKEMTIFSSYIFINMVVDQINWNIDKFIIGRFHGTSSVAVYGVAAQFNAYYTQISTAISNVFTPRIHRMVARKESNSEISKLFTKVGRVQFIVIFLILSGFIFYGRFVIDLWVGNEYKDSYSIALCLLIPVTIPLIQNVGIEIQRAKNMHKFRTWCYLFIAIFNFLLSLPLTRKFGALGAAIGTGISLIIGNGIIMNIYNHVRIKINIKYFWRNIVSFVPSLLLPMLFGIVSNLFFNLEDVRVLLISGIFYILVYSLSIILFGMNEFEKKIIISVFVKVKSIVRRRH